MWKLLEPRSTAARTSGTRSGMEWLASGGEGRSAAASSLGVRVADHELRALEVLAVVDLRAAQVLEAHRVHQQAHAAILDAGVALFLVLVEREAVLEARAAAARDE